MRRGTRLWLTLFVGTMGACGGDELASEVELASPEESGQTCEPVWSPTWRQASGINAWWVEYTITGGTVTQAHLEVPGRGTVQLSYMWEKWVGGSSFAITSGTQVILHATNSLGQSAQTFLFPYMVETSPQTDPCAGACVPSCDGKQCGDDGCGGSCGTCPTGSVCQSNTCVASCVPSCSGKQCGDDGCGGSCGTCPTGFACDGGLCAEITCPEAWDPLWQQGTNASTRYAEYTITRATVVAASLEVVGGRTVQLRAEAGKWVATLRPRIARGTQVILHAEGSLGETAKTKAFRYLIDTTPVTDTCEGGGTPTPCAPLPAGLLSIDFDDAWAAQRTLARAPLLERDLHVTMYIVTRAVAEDWVGFLTTAQLLEMAADGHEIASHSVDHPHLESISDAQLEFQLAESKRWLEANITSPIRSFATPYGVIDDRLVEAAKRHYQNQRGGQPGLNFPGDDPYRLKAEAVLRPMTAADVRAKIEDAKAKRGWQILVFHDFTTGRSNDPYVYDIADFSAVLDEIVASGIEVVTVGEGVERIRCSEAP